jgi:hypothetical protein
MECCFHTEAPILNKFFKLMSLNIFLYIVLIFSNLRYTNDQHGKATRVIYGK